MKQKSSLTLSLNNLLSHALPKRLFMTTFALLFSCFAMAEVVEVDGIRYNVFDALKTAAVVSSDTKYSGDISIPSSITVNGNEYTVTGIGSYAFTYCEKLTSITIPESVTSIGNDAFRECTHLTSINIPNGVTSIASSAFENCSALTSINIPDGVTSIGSSAFKGCSALTSINIPDGVTSISSRAFYNCSALTSITLPNSVKHIEDGAFSSSGLTSVVIPNSVTYIGASAFSGSALTSITIPEGVGHVADNAFMYCSSLVTAYIFCKYLGESAFYGCSNLASVTIGNPVRSIGIQAFDECYNLETVNITDIAAWCEMDFAIKTTWHRDYVIYDTTSNPLYYGAKLYLNGQEVKDLVIPNSVTFISEYAFFLCKQLTSLSLGSSVESIGEKAFSGCDQISNIIIGESTKEIGEKAFANCEYIDNVTCLAKNVPSTKYNAFEGTYIQYATLTVPEESVEQYRSAEPWKNFGLIMTTNGDVPVIPTTPKCAKPTISYANSKLVFASETEGVSFISNIKDNDIKSYYSSEIPLSATYEISVYATKTDYDNSDVTTATLIWLDARLEGETTNAKEMAIPSMPLLITQDNGILTVSGLQDGDMISAYSIDGRSIATSKAFGDSAILDLSELQGKVAILNVAGRSAKVMVK